MDTNKLEVLREIEYSLHKVCGRCKHSRLSADGWGTCALFTYEHQKHTGERRQLSITQYGSCPAFKPSDDHTHDHYLEFE